MANMSAKLPAELRILIFKKCIKRRCVTTLYLDKALHNELLLELYEYYVFTMTVEPGYADSRVTLFGETKHFLPVQFDHILQPAYFRDKEIPFDRFKRLDIRILPPDRRDPGQLVRRLASNHKVAKMVPS